jgi:hypothetical protein
MNVLNRHGMTTPIHLNLYAPKEQAKPISAISIPLPIVSSLSS